MGGSSTTTQRNDPYAPAQPLINEGLSAAKSLYDKGGFNITPYQGQLMAGRDQFSTASDNATLPQVGQNLGAINAAQGGAMRALDPTLRSGAFDQVKQNVIADIMPSINGSFAGSGMTGSSLHAQNLSKGLTAGMANVENQAFQQGENRALTAAGMIPGLGDAANSQLSFLSGVGADRQKQSQAEINAQVFQDQQGKTAEMDAVRNYLALTTGAGGQFGVQTSTTKKRPGLFGMLGAGMQAAPFLFSDRRLKEDIKRVGETDDGLPIYTYKYTGGDTYHMGVMADELAEVNPSAVVEIQGYKAVNYGAI